MKLYSTNNKKKLYSLKEAVLLGLAPDGGLFMPETIPTLPSTFLKNLNSYTFKEIAYHVTRNFIGSSIDNNTLEGIIDRSVWFPAPLHQINTNSFVQELYHGPSLAFKDFGAQFMAQLMSHFYPKDSQKKLIILVATSGDTGGAVAAGFHNVPGIEVVILYPKGKVSTLQEKQLTTFGNNISAVEIDGTFDDCQRLAKSTLNDKSLTTHLTLSSANSINIARLIPQMFYYFEGYKQLSSLNKPIVYSVPSGNFGNLTAGLLAKRMGLPIQHFITATNINDVVPRYLTTGVFTPKASVATLSNAMDVGAPSNFDRINDLFCSTWNTIRKEITGYSYTDEETTETLKQVNLDHQYLLDPHGAIAYRALEAYLSKHSKATGISLETAHPSKFKSEVDNIINDTIPLHPTLEELIDLPSRKTSLPTSKKMLHAFLLDHYA